MDEVREIVGRSGKESGMAFARRWLNTLVAAKRVGATRADVLAWAREKGFRGAVASLDKHLSNLRGEVDEREVSRLTGAYLGQDALATERRKNLNGDLSRWLHDFILLSRAEQPWTTAELKRLSGCRGTSENEEQNFRGDLREALAQLEECDPPLLEKGSWKVTVKGAVFFKRVADPILPLRKGG